MNIDESMQAIESLKGMPLYEYEHATKLAMLPYLVKTRKNDFKWVIWGGGRNGRSILLYLNKTYGITPDYIIDNYIKNKEIGGVQVITGDEFSSMKMDECFVIVTPFEYTLSNGMTQMEISRQLFQLKKNTPKVIEYLCCETEYRMEFRDYILDNIDVFKRNIGLFSDDLSRETFFLYLKSYVTDEVYEGVTFPERCKYWGSDKEGNRLYKQSQDEVLINIGGASGDTVFYYLTQSEGFKKIYTIEANAKTYAEKLLPNLEYIDEETRSKIFPIMALAGEGEESMDTLFADEKITLINMDVEGAEMNVLKSGINVIKRDRPVLAVCAYHRISDLIDIPIWIKENLEYYKLFLRMYPSPLGHFIDQVLRVSEMVLYGVPNERL